MLNRSGTVAVFGGAASALAAAVDWQRAEHPTPRHALAVTVAELDRESDSAVTSAGSAVLMLARSAAVGQIVATQVVRLLVPSPDCGSWAATPGAGSDDPAIHELQWSPIPAVADITVVVAEDAAIIRAGIINLLTADGMRVVGQAGDYDSILSTVRDTRPQLLITDVRMPPDQSDEGLRAAAILRAEQRDLSVLVLSQYVQASAAADLLTGQTSGVGYLLKERVTALQEFLDAARVVAGGGTVIDPLITQQLLAKRRPGNQLAVLADRERTVLELMAQGLSNSAIADQLILSARTVESHVRSIMTKLDIWEDPAGNRRVQAVIRWLDQH